MATYSAKIRTRAGVRSVELHARNEREARAHAERLGQVIVFRRRLTLDMGRSLNAADRQLFFTRLSSMLGSRVGASDALALLRDTFGGRIQEVSARLLSFVETGDDLASAMEKVGAPDFPEATVALIKAGSRSGESSRAVRDAARFESELADVKKGAAKGLIAGVTGFVIAGVTTVASTLYVGPVILDSPLMKMAAAKGDLGVGWIFTAGNILGYTMAVMMGLGLLFYLFAAAGRRLAPVKVDRAILRIPFYKDLVLAKNNFIVLYGLALLVRSGVRIEEALRLAADGAPRGALRNDLLNAMAAVRTGRSWPKVMETLHPTDKASLVSATDREQVANTLDTLAAQYRALYAQRLAAFVPTLQMLAALFLTLSGGILFGLSILPMLKASENMM
jgi:general secretion pathway protein F